MSAPRIEPKSWPREIAECGGTLAMALVGLGVLSGRITVEQIGGGMHTVGTTVQAAASFDPGTVVVPVLLVVAGLAILAGSVGLLIRVIRKGRKTFVFYRARWSRVMRDNGLIERDGEQVRVPRLRSVRTGHDIDTLSVRMLPSQSVADWQAKAGRLADDFRAAGVRIVIDPDLPYTNVGLVVDRSRGGLRKELLPPVAPLALPPAAPRQVVLPPRRTAAHQPIPRHTVGRARGQLGTLRLDWVRVWRIDEHGRAIRGSRRWDLRVMWGWQWATETL